MTNWDIIYCARDEKCVTDFIEMLDNVARAVAMRMNKPRKVVIRDDRTETYLQNIQKSINNNVELIVIIFPTNRTDRYSAVKK